MAKVLKSVVIDVAAETLAAGKIDNLSLFLNESIYAYCAKDLSEEARAGIPTEKLITQQLVTLQKEHAATVAELETIKATTEAQIVELEYQLRLAKEKIQRLEFKTRKRLKESKPIGRAVKIAELKKELENKDLTEKQRTPIITEIAKLVRSLPEGEKIETD